MVLQAWSMFMLLSLSASDAADANGDDDDELLFFMMTMVVVASLKVVYGLRRGLVVGTINRHIFYCPLFLQTKRKCTSTNG